jgi:hypothetical protein
MNYKGSLQNFYMQVTRSGNICQYITEQDGSQFITTLVCPAVATLAVRIPELRCQGTAHSKKVGLMVLAKKSSCTPSYSEPSLPCYTGAAVQ